MRSANVGDRTYVSDASYCTAFGNTYQNIIHIYRDENLAAGHACKTCLDGHGPGLRIRWREGEPLAAMSVPLADLIQYARRPGRLLVHCSAGASRSPSLAVVAKVVRGRHPMDAIRDVIDGLRQGTGSFPCFVNTTMESILDWAENQWMIQPR